MVRKTLADKRIRQRREHGSFSELGQAALSALLATEAAQRRDVKMFRRALDDLVPVADVAKWVDSQHAREERELSTAEWAGHNGDAISFEYPGPGRHVISRPDIRVGGLLLRLHYIGDALARRFGWQRAQAVAFVLSDARPLVAAVSVGYRENTAYPRLSRIVLDIDPTMGPRQVLDIYRQARRKFVSTRPRSIAARSTELIQFYCDHWGEGLSWREQMRLWNRQHSPAFRFSVETNYAKQTTNSIRSLLMADYALWSKGEQR